MMKNIILFGKPGAGKGTQAALLRDAFQLVHISTGDLFRHNIGNNTSLGALAKSYMDQGDLVPDEVTIKMLEAEVDANPDAGGFIFDGFHRTAKQARQKYPTVAKISVKMDTARKRATKNELQKFKA